MAHADRAICVGAERPQEPAAATQTSDNELGGYRTAAGIFLLCAVALAWPFLSGAYTIPWDAKAHFQPQFAFLAHALHRGQSPFWTPNVFAGMPQIADPQSLIFSPFFLIAAAIVPEPSFWLEDVLVLAMLAMGGLALMAYFRDRGWHAGGALLAALAFAFGGSASWRIQHTGQIMSLAWLPVTLWLLARALDRRSARWGAGAGVAAAFLVLGRDQVAFLSVLLLSAYAVFRVATGAESWKTAVRPLLSGALAGGALVAIPLLFTLLLAAQSNRPAIDLDGAFKASLPPGSFFTLICANLFGVDGPLRDFWGPPSQIFGTADIYLARNMATLYVGALPLVALIASFGRCFLRPSEIKFFTGAFIVFVIYALGRYTPLFAAIFHIPGVDLWRRPADATFLLGFTLALLGGYGFSLLLESETRTNPVRLALTAAMLLALCAGVAVDKGRLAQASGPLTIAAFSWTMAVSVAVFAPRLAQSHGFAALALIGAATAFDLGMSNKPNESTALPPAQFEVLNAGTRNETIAFLKQKLEGQPPDRRDRIELAAIDFHWPNASLVHDLDHDLGYNPIRLKLFEDTTGAIDHVALPEQRTFSKLYPRYRSPISDLLGLRYIATGVPIEEIDHRLEPGDVVEIARTKDAHIYEYSGALPRVLLPVCARQADFAGMIETGVWPRVDFRETVLIEQPTLCRRSGPDQLAGEARITSYENTRVVVDAEAPPGGGWLVLNDVWHPWWFAYVDGVEAPMLRANVMFRAVETPEGRHRIEFRFEPLRGAFKEWLG